MLLSVVYFTIAKCLSVGVYSPRSKGHSNTEVCLEQLAEDISEARESGYKIYNYTAVIYVNMCDITGRAVPDIYV